jgi:hypothetical protein
LKDRIVSHNAQGFMFCLGNQQSIEGVFMVTFQLKKALGMVRRNIQPLKTLSFNIFGDVVRRCYVPQYSR